MKSNLLFATSEKDGLVYIKPARPSQRKSVFRDVVAEIGLVLDRVLFGIVRHG